MSTRQLPRMAWKDHQMTSRPVARRGLLIGAGSLLATAVRSGALPSS